MKWEAGSSLTAKEKHVCCAWTEGAKKRANSASMCWGEIRAFTLYSRNILGASFHFYYICVWVYIMSQICIEEKTGHIKNVINSICPLSSCYVSSAL